MATTVHAAAIVDAGAQLGDDGRVWHFVHISADARIGAGCSFGQTVHVGNDVVIGSNLKIQNNVTAYDAVTLEDDVFCGPSRVFTNLCNPHAEVTRKDEYCRTLVRQGAALGANRTVVCGIMIGGHAFIAAGAVVNLDVTDFALTAGVPTCQIGRMSQFGERLRLPLSNLREATCPHNGDRDRLDRDHLQLVTANASRKETQP